MRVLAAVWIGGGMLVAIAALSYLWRSNLSQPFAALAVAGGLLLVVAAMWLAAAAASHGSSLAIVGLVAVVVGIATGFFGGLILIVPGAVLYVLGVYRARILESRAQVIAVVLLVLAVATIPVGNDEVVGLELSAAAAIATGLAAGGAAPPRHARTVK